MLRFILLLFEAIFMLPSLYAVCDPGFYLLGASCEACTAGYYKGANGGEACTQTSAGYYPSQLNLESVTTPQPILSDSWRFLTASSTLDKLAIVSRNDYIYTSVNSGITWTVLDYAGDTTWHAVVANSNFNELIVTVDGGYITHINLETEIVTPLKSAGSRTWRGVTANSDLTKILACVGTGTNNYIYRYVDSTWAPLTTAGRQEWQGVACTNDFAKIVATVYSGRMWISTDSGATFTSTGPAKDKNWRMVSINSDFTKLIAAVDSKFWISYNSGDTWSEIESAIDNGSTEIYGVVANTNFTKFVYTATGGVYYSDDAGSSWVVNGVALSGGTKVLPCSAGKYATVGSTAMSGIGGCVQCVEGKYTSADIAATSCINCPIGKWSAVGTSVGESGCIVPTNQDVSKDGFLVISSQAPVLPFNVNDNIVSVPESAPTLPPPISIYGHGSTSSSQDQDTYTGDDVPYVIAGGCILVFIIIILLIYCFYFRQNEIGTDKNRYRRGPCVKIVKKGKVGIAPKAGGLHLLGLVFHRDDQAFTVHPATNDIEAGASITAPSSKSSGSSIHGPDRSTFNGYVHIGHAIFNVATQSDKVTLTDSVIDELIKTSPPEMMNVTVTETDTETETEIMMMETIEKKGDKGDNGGSLFSSKRIVVEAPVKGEGKAYNMLVDVEMDTVPEDNNGDVGVEKRKAEALVSK